MTKFLSFLLFCTYLSIQAHTLPSGGVELNSPLYSTVDGIGDKVLLYPNPATSFFQVKSTQTDIQIAEVSVYSLLGNVVLSRRFSSPQSQSQLNINNLKKGKYLVKVLFTDNTTEVKALIKQ